jgi:hypothetical protein
LVKNKRKTDSFCSFLLLSIKTSYRREKINANNNIGSIRAKNLSINFILFFAFFLCFIFCNQEGRKEKWKRIKKYTKRRKQKTSFMESRKEFFIPVLF